MKLLSGRKRQKPRGEWVADERNSPERDFEVEHLDGTWWHQAPIPPRHHQCKAQTRGFYNYFSYVERCACGAIRLRSSGPWMNRNDRRPKSL